ncbi:TPA: site-specific DNA-methyltransferase [Serratia marcescens]|uniref:site-specific DNA-methyltransferase (adenine-specific) n=1 Tax=Serratia nevei TaxID=2703794 RepID=A0ABT7G5F6_9GAMM|nr:site-specific DNA-methyltransferase [Serratia nevei]HAU4290827.1 site-specific DNA-methyltransferase [Serratia marcescens]MDK5168997.1 site-specific DNA-methyltransferase [Serratia nevei]MDK5298491.1 site-specific DNA-methyltransferase [Serratia nevei]MEC5887257.1 site-specific DNA-methyltransferase [Serratia nevei]HAU4297519.1 site-specific DNA-methyltransferase [Serratia marcescens]
MPEIQFKGKEFVFNHHLSVPYRPLVPHKNKSIGAGNINDNLVVHGDNLHALKALMPMYAGKIDCIFIDPPYNTGNEGWAYNDNVNSPMIKEWLSSNPVNKDDMLKHDKWLAMMYPRLKLLHELLAEHGSFWMTLDDNEVHRARMMLDEIFGENNFLADVSWEKADSPRMDVEFFSSRQDHMLVYAKNLENVCFNRIQTTDIPQHYDKEDDGGRKYYLKPLRAMGGQGETRAARPNLYYAMKAPDGSEVFPVLTDGTDGAWRWSKEKTENEKDRIEWKVGKTGWTPYFRIYADTLEGRPPETIFFNSQVGSSRTSKLEIKNLFPEGSPFDTPKPVGLLDMVLQIATEPGMTILDSFAGSGTTAHAVLAMNKRDSKSDRKFILVECEPYADTTTAERVRRVINGVPTSKDKALKAGTGGSFTYCTLGEPIDIDKILTGENLPDYQSIGSWLFHTATGEALNVKHIKEKEFFLGESNAYCVWLIYKPSLDFLKSRDAALTLSFAEKIAQNKNKKHLVFAPAKYVPNKTLLPLGVEYAPLPFALYRVEK